MHNGRVVQFEVLPVGAAIDAEVAATPPLSLTITCSPRHGIDRTVAAAARHAAAGHCVTPHLAARQVKDAAHLDALLETMRAAGVDQAFVIGGDAPAPEGPFASADDLLHALDGHSLRPARVGIAAYPEGHPAIDGERLRDALAAKAQRADYAVTQMCFHAGALDRWLRATRAAGIAIPVVLGVPGVVERRKLLEVSARIGVGESLRFLRKQHGVLRLVAGRPSHVAASLLRDLAPLSDDASLGVAGLHLYTFNRLAATYAWARTQRIA